MFLLDHSLRRSGQTQVNSTHAVTLYWEGFNSNYPRFVVVSFYRSFNGAAFYQQVETGIPLSQAITAAGIVRNGLNGQPPRIRPMGICFLTVCFCRS